MRRILKYIAKPGPKSKIPARPRACGNPTAETLDACENSATGVDAAAFATSKRRTWVGGSPRRRGYGNATGACFHAETHVWVAARSQIELVVRDREAVHLGVGVAHGPRADAARRLPESYLVVEACSRRGVAATTRRRRDALRGDATGWESRRRRGDDAASSAATPSELQRRRACRARAPPKFRGRDLEGGRRLSSAPWREPAVARTTAAIGRRCAAQCTTPRARRWTSTARGAAWIGRGGERCGHTLKLKSKTDGCPDALSSETQLQQYARTTGSTSSRHTRIAAELGGPGAGGLREPCARRTAS